MGSENTTLFRSRERAVNAALRTFDLVALTASFPIAYLVRDRIFGERYIGHPGLYPIGQYWPLLAASLLSWTGVSWSLRLYRLDRLRGAASELYRVTRTVLIVIITISAVGFLAKQGAMSRLFVLFYFGISMGLLVCNRLLLRSALIALRRKGFSTRVLAVVGTGEVARNIAEAILTRREWGYHFAGFIEENGETGPRRAGPLLGSIHRLEQILDNRVLDEIIFAVPQERLATLQAAARLCNERGVTARVCLDLTQHGLSQLSLDELNGFPLLDFH
ncbi:MAG TPA: hypothetical protein VMK12_31695 [Anaeromyxobacteraceae bacterium]|nr:hypothetical protein [Anaeromyxobacteraceae bacterium]